MFIEISDKIINLSAVLSFYKRDSKNVLKKGKYYIVFVTPRVVDSEAEEIEIAFKDEARRDFAYNDILEKINPLVIDS